MDPAKFGPFLRDMRKERGLTQTDLAGRLHVSAAAVSKWERSKALPDIAKLEDLAEALGLNVLELMKCERRQAQDPERELREVYAQTLAAANEQNRRKLSRYAVCVLCAAVLLLAMYFFPIYRMAKVWTPGFYDTGEVSMLAYIGSRRDRATAQIIMTRLEEAFSDLTSEREKAEKKHGLLARYAPGRQTDGAVSETHSLWLWSARFWDSEGYIWLCYSQEIKAADGRVSGSYHVPVLLRLEKDSAGAWTVAHVKEHP